MIGVPKRGNNSYGLKHKNGKEIHVDKIKEFVARVREQVAAWRHAFHSIPEAAYHEFDTSRYIREQLTSLSSSTAKFEVMSVGKTALVVTIGSGAPVVGCRFNMDGLAGCTEATGLGHASTRAGFTHACGHDVELAWALGIARYMSEHPPTRGTLKLIFQPAEEGPGDDALGRDGGKFLADEGAFDGLSALFSWHVDSAFELGRVCVREGVATVRAYDFTFELTGVASHLSRPDDGVNPIWAMQKLLAGLEVLSKMRAVRPDEYFQCHVSQVGAGMDPANPFAAEINTLPARVIVRGSSRVLGASWDYMLKSRLEELRFEACGSGIDCKLTLNMVAVEASNNADLVALTRECASDAGFVTSSEVKYWKDAAGWTAEKAPICHGYIGCGGVAGRLHTSTFYPPDEVLPIGLEMFIRQIERALVR